MKIFKIAIMALSVLAIGCDDDLSVPKPHAFPKVVFPKKAYQAFDANYCSFSFEQPVYAQLERDTTFFDGKAKSDCWFNLKVPELNAVLHCSYYAIGTRADFDELIKDSYDLVEKHNVKASFIEESELRRPPAQRVYGKLFNIEGPAASPYQFYVTDSTRHFLRGALYFRSQSRPDSMAPVIKFMKQDINHLVETLTWQ